jgi:predicted RNA-binding Zn-ribbon protein involved in translation (DUF1610 family)
MASTADRPFGPEVPVGARTFRCAGCGFPITLRPGEHAPECPRCGSERFERSSIFSSETAPLPAPTVEREPAWLATVRERILVSGPHLAWDSGGRIETTFIQEGVTRIGRSFLAQIQLLDPTVSRRHAMIHRSGHTCVVLDDHSLNGVFVGGERIDWRPLEDGDEVEIGRFRLYFLDDSAV